MPGQPATSYRKLDRSRNEIRVVLLQPAKDVVSDIECSLVHIAMDDGRAFEALSYTWDSDIFSGQIILDGKPFSVTENLQAALQAFRHVEKTRYLWIDQISINQNDIEERNQEVLRMLSIYKAAEQVIVWLGAGSRASDLAMGHLETLSSTWDARASRSYSLSASEHFLSAILALSQVLYHFLLAAIQRIRLNLPYGIALALCSYAYCQNTALWTTYVAMLVSLSFHCQYAFRRRSSAFLRVPFSVDLTLWLYVARAYAGRWVVHPTMLILLSFAWRTALERWWREAGKVPPSVEPSQTTIFALREVFEKPWFTRTWVVQEIAAARTATVTCGSRSLLWHQLTSAVWQIEDLVNSSTSVSPYLTSSYQRMKPFITIIERDAFRNQNADRHSFLLLLLHLLSNSDA